MSDQKIKLLVVEDDAGYATLLCQRLAQETNPSFDVEHADTLQAGLKCLHNKTIDAVLLDLTLPDSQGLDTFKKVQAEAPNLPIVILTGIDKESFGLESLKKGAEEYLLKGELDSKVLSRVIRYAIERHQVKRELDSANARLESLALLDPLTELLNRRGLQEVLSREIQWTHRDDSSFIVFLVDLDNFKQINDTLGHPVGDVVLKEIANGLKAALRTTDYVARIGGDEFMVLLPQTRLAEGMRVAERARLAISQASLSLFSGTPVTVTASLGVTTVSQAASTIDELLATAYLALHKSKQEGKNRVTYEYKGKKGPAQNGRLMPDILEALRKGDQFYALAQPIVQISDLQVVGQELLSRSTVEGFEMPDDFFRLCLEHNILTLVDHRCFESCVAASASFAPEIRCHVNLFPSTLINIPVQHLVDALPASRLKGSYCIEISEQQIIGDPSYLIAAAKALRRAGILVALDDVGFGRSCLESLILLEPDIVKIDKKYVLGIARDEARARSLRRILKVTESLGIEVIAEGIESEEDLSLLKQLDVKYGQGFLWGKPAAIPSKVNRMRSKEQKSLRKSD